MKSLAAFTIIFAAAMHFCVTSVEAQSPGANAWANFPSFTETFGANNIIPVFNGNFLAGENIGLEGTLSNTTINSGWRLDVRVDGMNVVSRNFTQADPTGAVLFVFAADGSFNTEIGVVDLLLDGSSILVNPLSSAAGGGGGGTPGPNDQVFVVDMSAIGGAVTDVPDIASTIDQGSAAWVDGVMEQVDEMTKRKYSYVSESDKEDFASLFNHVLFEWTYVLEHIPSEIRTEMGLPKRSDSVEESSQVEKDAYNRLIEGIKSRAEPPITDGDNILMLLPTIAGAAIGGGKASPLPERVERFGLFASGDYQHFEFDIDANSSTTTQNHSATAGAFFRLNSDWSAGLATSYLDGDSDLDGTASGTETDGVALVPFLSHRSGGLSNTFLYSAGWIDNDIRRNVGGGNFATADPETTTHAISWKRSYQARLGPFVTGPVGSLSYITGETDAYTETGGGASNVSVGERDFDSLLTELGWRAALPHETSFGRITPYVEATWNHDWVDDADPVGVSLPTSPFSIFQGNTFVRRTGGFGTSVAAARADNDFVAVSAGVAVEFPDDFTIRFDVLTEVFRDDVDQTFLSIGAKKTF